MLGVPLNTFSQRVCGSVLDMDELQRTDTVRYQRIMNFERQTLDILRGTKNIPDEIVIPVVVHVVYKNSTENISDAQINAQIQVLNEDFQRLNSDAVNTPAAFQSIAGSTKINFKLAKLDPDGNPTTGITRTSTTNSGFLNTTNDVKYNSSGGHDAWNTLWYLNIWICDFASSSLMGYAQFPDQLYTNPNTDGVVISYKYFGKDNPSYPSYNKGRTTTHEVGHWLNLRHIWGDAHNCTATDFVDDTPNQYQSTFGCPSFPQTDACTTSNPGIMFMNYMDYSYDHCMNIFTKGQVERMLALFDTQVGIRKDMMINAHCLTQSILNFTNQTVTNNTTVTNNCDISIQNVRVRNGAKLILDAAGEVNIIGDFEVELGSEFEIRQGYLLLKKSFLLAGAEFLFLAG